MRVEFDPTTPQEWHQHFQAPDVFIGDRYQRGGSLGSFLRGLLRFVIPVVKSAGSAVAKEALRTGAAIATDVAEGRAIGEAALARARQGVENLTEEAIEAGATEVKKSRQQKGRGLGKRPAKSINTVAPPKKKQKKSRRKQDALGFY